MGIGVSVFLIAAGAVLAFAVDVEAAGIDLDTVGLILMLAGMIGLAATLFLFNGGGLGRCAGAARSWRTAASSPRRARRRVVRRRVEY